MSTVVATEFGRLALPAATASSGPDVADVERRLAVALSTLDPTVGVSTALVATARDAGRSLHRRVAALAQLHRELDNRTTPREMP